MTPRIPPVENYRPVRGLRAWLADRSPAVPGQGTRLHAGVDLAAPRGTPVVAPEAGLVTAVARTSPGNAPRAPWTGYGPEVVVVLGQSGRYHLLSHVQRPSVAVGDTVEMGDEVAEVSNLAHVHWEVRLSERTPRGVETVENVLDPMAWLEGRDVPFDTAAPQRCPSKLGKRTPRCCRARLRGTRSAPDGGGGAA